MVKIGYKNWRKIVPKVLRIRHTKPERIKYAIEMRKANKNATELQRQEKESNRLRREERNKIMNELYASW